MWWSMVVRYLRLSATLIKHNLSAVLEYRAAFLMQSLGMILNDICWVLLWSLFFGVFPSIAGWEFRDTMLIFALSCYGFGLFMAFMAGALSIARIIYSGELDYFLGLPKNPLWLITMSRMEFSGIGDILAGIAIAAFFGALTPFEFILFLLLGVTLALGVLGFVVITQSLSFFVGNFEDAARELFWSIVTFGIYPVTTFTGALKILICTVIPAFFLFGIPVRLLQNFGWEDLLVLLAFTLFILVLAVTIFSLGLKRYESGSLVQVRV